MNDLRSRLGVPHYSAVWIATALLFAISPLLDSGSLGSAALLSMLPFASILAIAAIGQTLVIQQRGLDLSVPGMITLTTIIVTQYPNGAGDKLPAAIGLVLAACVISGLVSGFAVTRLGITPLVATLGVNALLLGTVYHITSGQATATSTSGLASFAVSKWLGIPVTVYIALATIGALAIVIRTTAIGRRFVAAGASPAAAHCAGIPVRGYLVATYVIASLTYGGAGILIAGFLQTPGIAAGNDYLLPTIVAVVLGGTSLAGGTGSIVATAVGAVFLTQLELVVDGLGAPQSVHYIIQGSIIALGMALRNVPWRKVRGWIATAGAARAARPAVGGPGQ